MRASHTITPVFDDPNLVSAAGLVPVMRLAESAGLDGLLAEHLRVGSPNAPVKAGCVIGGMLSGADSIDDLGVLRHGAMGRLFGGLRAPSTLGTYLRSLTHGHVQQLDAVSTRLLAGLAARAPGLLAGAGPEGIAFIDVDDSVRLATDGTEQGELFAAHRHHGFITNSTLATIEADQRHRDHAVVEQVIAELKDGPIAHLPSGSYAANAAWLAHAVIAFNLARTAGVLASNRHARARWATLRTHLINVPARVASSARKLTLHLPANWPWADAWQTLVDAANAPPDPSHHLTNRPNGHARGPKWKSRTDRPDKPRPLQDPPRQPPENHLEIKSVDQG